MMGDCMHIDYRNDKVREQCTNLRVAKKLVQEKVAKKLLQMINFIDAADNLASIINNPTYHFHNLKGSKKGFYAMDIDGRRSSYRLVVKFTDYSNEQIFSDATSIEVIEIEEVSNHYE